jgi:sterol desaturase/sphingolipid hydroxylase (fatty acid hydroxylase superfamily)
MIPVQIFGWPEPVLRLSAFLGILVLMMGLEVALPKRSLVLGRLRRWPANLAILVLDGALVRVMGVLGSTLVAVSAAQWAANRGWGLLNHIDGPAALEALIAVIVLDALIWAQHVVFHRVPLLWRIHRMHHTDRDFDVTTALRFHPVEIGLSMLIKVSAVVLLGAPPVAVVIFEIVLNGCAMFNHSNLRLPVRLDAGLRTVIVTPDMHRVHHSVYPGEHHRNFGFNLSIWDRLFGSYVAQPRDGHQDMRIGLPGFQSEDPASLWWCLKLPFTAGEPAARPADKR